MCGIFGFLKELTKAVIGAIVCIFCLGPALMVIGGVFLSASTNPARENAILQYQSALSTWQGINATTFASAFNWQIVTGTVSGLVTSALLRSTSGGAEETYFMAQEPGVSPILPILRYETTINAGTYVNVTVVGPAGSFSFPSSSLPYTLTRTATVSSLGCRTGTCTQSTSSAQQTCQNKPLCSVECPSRGGTWNSVSQICTFTFYLQSACIIADDAGIVDMSRGCYYETYMYDLSNPIPRNNLGKYSSSAPSRVRIQVRNSRDPIIYVSSVTSGSYNFGMSVEQKRTFGIAFLGAGGAVIMLLLCIVWACVAARRRQTQHVMQVVPATPTPQPTQAQPNKQTAVNIDNDPVPPYPTGEQFAPHPSPLPNPAYQPPAPYTAPAGPAYPPAGPSYPPPGPAYPPAGPSYPSPYPQQQQPPSPFPQQQPPSPYSQPQPASPYQQPMQYPTAPPAPTMPIPGMASPMYSSSPVGATGPFVLTPSPQSPPPGYGAYPYPPPQGNAYPAYPPPGGVGYPPQQPPMGMPGAQGYYMSRGIDGEGETAEKGKK
ncbi:hypothetical protein AMAG_10964 [Allomyces macrogynus ATCC 38327]|uniref:Uncharacterized protein n=1 Tax=Allomyces macrogynus (strain ATCC 38327) TaxID=578462 RepID=A0A0L0SRZ0_ALLM3|nr:hypothetical protein AMAG_10964 [Allomyces macrogynus ATCC 38327]|eukprot:KNE65323.1 hypothetical protein AMAG_10964 [Allomyces macrogynus ATCC 38327]